MNERIPTPENAAIAPQMLQATLDASSDLYDVTNSIRGDTAQALLTAALAIGTGDLWTVADEPFTISFNDGSELIAHGVSSMASMRNFCKRSWLVVRLAN